MIVTYTHSLRTEEDSLTQVNLQPKITTKDYDQWSPRQVHEPDTTECKQHGKQHNPIAHICSCLGWGSLVNSKQHLGLPLPGLPDS